MVLYTISHGMSHGNFLQGMRCPTITTIWDLKRSIYGMSYVPNGVLWNFLSMKYRELYTVVMVNGMSHGMPWDTPINKIYQYDQDHRTLLTGRPTRREQPMGPTYLLGYPIPVGYYRTLDANLCYRETSHGVVWIPSLDAPSLDAPSDVPEESNKLQ